MKRIKKLFAPLLIVSGLGLIVPGLVMYQSIATEDHGIRLCAYGFALFVAGCLLGVILAVARDNVPAPPKSKQEIVSLQRRARNRLKNRVKATRGHWAVIGVIILLVWGGLRLEKLMAGPVSTIYGAIAMIAVAFVGIPCFLDAISLLFGGVHLTPFSFRSYHCPHCGKGLNGYPDPGEVGTCEHCGRSITREHY